MYRVKVFYDNLDYIESNQGDTWSLGINEFADMTNEEFRHLKLSLIVPERHTNTRHQIKGRYELTEGSVNWVTEKKTPPVQNQGSCGSCWAFSATEAIDAAYAVSKNQNVLLSVEQLVECSSAEGNMGCSGGWMSWAFNYVMANPLSTETDYPYTAGNGFAGKCNVNIAGQGKYGITSY